MNNNNIPSAYYLKVLMMISRFGFFCGSALEFLKVRGVQADVLHCHDWPTAPVAWGDRGQSKCVFTIHNLSYGADLVGRAMASCEVATTVSPTYAREVRPSTIMVSIEDSVASGTFS